MGNRPHSSALCPRARDSVYNNDELRHVSTLGKMATELEKSDDALRAALIVAGGRTTKYAIPGQLIRAGPSGHALK